MAASSSLRKRLGSASLFARLLVFSFVTVLAAQAVTFGLVLAMPAPLPPGTSLRDVASALQMGTTDRTRLQVTLGDMPVDNWVDPAEKHIAERLAVLLRVPANHVRVVSFKAFFDNPPFPADEPAANLFHPPSPDMRWGIGKGPPPPRAMITNTGVIMGRFDAALRLEDGRWRRVTLKRGLIEAWQWRVLLWFLGSTAVVAPFAWFFAKRISDPIAAFGTAAREVGRNPHAAPVPLRGPPEIVEASVALADMQRQLARYVEDRTMMVGAIAHDLRTPLMRLTLRLQKVPGDVRGDCERDIAEMEAMVAATLSFVRDLSVRADRHRIALLSLIETVVDEFVDRDANVILEPSDDTTVFAELNGMKRMITNIVGNAITYAGSARVRLRADETTAVVEVEDNGPGIPSAELERVFDPFYRVEQSRNRHTGGTGLGLASARAVARAHGGDIVLSNRARGGLLATVTLPL